MHKIFLIIAASLGALSVVIGAFGAHALKALVNADTFQVFETAVKYQFYHVFALLACAILFQQFPNKFMRWSGNLFITGIILFCGSLYALTYLISIDSSRAVQLFIGFITPFGGLCFIAGWIFMAIGIAKK